MVNAMVALDWHESVEALYRQDSDRLWRAVRALPASVGARQSV